jgi:hypothetical protein
VLSPPQAKDGAGKREIPPLGEVVFRLEAERPGHLEAQAESLPIRMSAPTLEALQHEAREALIEHLGPAHGTVRVRGRRGPTAAASTNSPLTARNTRVRTISKMKPRPARAVMRTLALISGVNSTRMVALRARTFAVVSGQNGIRSMAGLQFTPCSWRQSLAPAAACIAQAHCGGQAFQPCWRFRPGA